jgi:YVTN family beta-propeller protein
LCSADDGNAIVALASGSTLVTVLDGRSAEVRATIDVGPSPWNAIARGPLVYVFMHTEPPADCLDAVQVVDVVAGRLVATIPLPPGSRPKIGVAAFERECLYSLNSGNGTVSEILLSLGTNAVTRTIEVGGGPQYGQRLNGSVFIANGASHDVAILDESTFTVTHRIGVGRGPERCVVYRDYAQVYTNNLDEQTLSIIDIETLSVVATVRVEPGPIRITPWDSRGRSEWAVLCRGGSIVFVDSDTHQVTETFRLPGQAANWNWGLGPRHQTVYVTLANEPALTVVDAAHLEVLGTLPLSVQPERAGYGPGIFISRGGGIFVACEDAVALVCQA